MNFSAIISSCIKDFISNKKESIRYLSISESLMKEIPSLMESGSYIIDLSKNFSPLKPFLEIIEKQKPSDELIKKYSYSLQEETLKSFFKYGVVSERTDFIISEEIFYEKQRYKDTIISIMKQICIGTYLILNAQYLSKEAIEILKDLEDTKICAKFIFCFDSEKIETASKDIMEYYEKINNQKNFYPISTNDFSETYEDEYNIQFENSPDFDTLYNALINNRIFLSLEQGCSIANWIINNINTFGFNSFQTRALSLEIGILFYYSFTLDEAALNLNNVLETQFDDEINILALLFLSKTLFLKNANNSALKYAMLTKQKLIKNKNSPYYAIAVMTEYLICEHSGTTTIDDYNLSLTLLNEQGLTNNYLKMMLTIPLKVINNPTSRALVQPKIEEGFRIAKKIGNKFGLSTACHWKGIITSFNGETEEALNWYYECNRIRTEIGDLTPMIKIRNGLAYEALIRANYSHSYNLINSFISRIDEINDYTEVIITLNNMANALFYSRHYSEAYTFFQKIMHFIHIFELEDTNYNSFIPEYNDILIYKTIIELDNSEIIRAKINYHNITHNGKAITPISQSLLNFLQASILAKEEKLKQSIETFETGINFFNQIEESQEHIFVFMLYEYATTLNKLGYKDEADKYLKKGFEIAKEKNFSYYTKNKDSITYDDYKNDISKFEAVRINLTYLEEKAEKERFMNQLHNRLHDYQFLNKTMFYGTDIINTKTYIRNILQAIFDYTMAKAVFLVEKNGLEWETIYPSSNEDFEIPKTNLLKMLFSHSSKLDYGKLVFNKENQLFFGNISKFEFIGGILIYTGKNTLLNTDIINTINIALSNVQAQLVMLKQNEHLLYISSTDQLSMLKNRRALQEYISMENEKLTRYKSKRKFTMQETIAFMDLDNFKYYNDTYGHEAGDLLIKCFSNSLKKIYRKVDFLSRFGGDEFVCLLTDTSCSEAERIAQRLYKELENNNYFIPELEQFLGCKLNISASKYINFSMGICSNYDIEESDNLDKVMANADKALYYSKAHGKGCISLWKDIKDCIQSITEPKHINKNKE